MNSFYESKKSPAHDTAGAGLREEPEKSETLASAPSARFAATLAAVTAIAAAFMPATTTTSTAAIRTIRRLSARRRRPLAHHGRADLNRPRRLTAAAQVSAPTIGRALLKLTRSRRARIWTRTRGHRARAIIGTTRLRLRLRRLSAGTVAASNRILPRRRPGFE